MMTCIRGAGGCDKGEGIGPGVTVTNEPVPSAGVVSRRGGGCDVTSGATGGVEGKRAPIW